MRTCTSFAPAFLSNFTTCLIVFPLTIESSTKTNRFPFILSSTAASFIFTKYYGIPGVRLGYALSGDARMLMNLKLHLPEWNVSSIAQRAGVAALNSKDFYSDTINLIATERKFLVQELKRVFSEAGKSVRIFNGQANYIMFKTDVELYQALLEQKILIRNCANYRLLGPGYYRIAVKNHEDNHRLIEAIRKVLNEG